MLDDEPSRALGFPRRREENAVSLADELAYITVVELAGRIRRREVSPVEVLEATIERIEARNPSLNALVYLGFDDARAAARAAEAALMSGEAVGLLHGVPAAIKDLFDFKPGWPSTFGGLPALRDLQLDIYCAFAERAEQAGAILVGKGNSPVMGFRGVCDNPLFGPSRNPFDTSRNTGGSSGGCAAAVADGLLTFAEGTDGGGSIRIPASWCGIYGLKQSFGRVPFISRPNAFGGTDPFLFEGPLTRTVEDAALVLTAIAGYDPRDPFSLDDPADFTGAVRRPIKGMRIAYTRDYDVFPIDRRIAAVVDEAVQAFERAGAHVEEAPLGIKRDQRELSDLWCRLIMPINVATIEGLKAMGFDVSDELPAQYREWLDRGYELTALDIANDQAMRTEVFDAFQDVFSRYDLIVGPTLSALPVKNGDDGNTVGPTEVEGVAVDPLIGWCPTYLVNYTGHPAASVPAGLADGLPVGMQIIGRSHADADVLAASAAFERLRPWRDTYRIPAERPL
jgi:amidase/aspartyl-tRNA(Asn)/glutamyl-tRNA(Gln) amidotransferase subunit A